MNTSTINPGATIGILGGGQLGKMTLQAAHRLGYHTAVLAEAGDTPAMEMATHRLTYAWDDPTGIRRLTDVCDVITTEWENVPLRLIKSLERRSAVVRPGSKVLEVAQSRLAEKLLADQLGIPTTRKLRVPVSGFDFSIDLTSYLPGILKTDRLGYDGKGQYRVETVDELIAAHQKAGVDCVLEKRVDLKYELSVLVARTADGRIKVSDAVENYHKEGILDRTIWPSSVSRKLIDAAQSYAGRVAAHLSLVGVLCLEFFVDGDDNLLFNEMAPRPHNSFHGSIEASYTCQFEQHIRAICGLPLGEVRFHTRFEMRNLIGGYFEDDWSAALVDPQSRLHIYGKQEPRPGRKMGHWTSLHR